MFVLRLQRSEDRSGSGSGNWAGWKNGIGEPTVSKTADRWFKHSYAAQTAGVRACLRTFERVVKNPGARVLGSVEIVLVEPSLASCESDACAANACFFKAAAFGRSATPPCVGSSQISSRVLGLDRLMIPPPIRRPLRSRKRLGRRTALANGAGRVRSARPASRYSSRISRPTANTSRRCRESIRSSGRAVPMRIGRWPTRLRTRSSAAPSPKRIAHAADHLPRTAALGRHGSAATGDSAGARLTLRASQEPADHGRALQPRRQQRSRGNR